VDFSAVPASVVRAIADAAFFVLFGTLLSRSVGVTGDLSSMRLQRGAVAVGAAALVLWFLLVAQSLIAGDLAETFDGLPSVAQTLFGHLVIVQIALLVVTAAALLLRAHLPALIAAGLLVAVQAAHLHAVSMFGLRPSVLLASEVMHVLGGAAWIGALPALLAALRFGSLTQARQAARRFGAVGAVGVLLLAVTAVYQSFILLGGISGAFGTAYGRIVIAKMLLFAVLLGFALRHRRVLLPRLDGADAASAQAKFARSVALELGTGLVIIVLAGLLNTAPPGMHMPM